MKTQIMKQSIMAVSLSMVILGLLSTASCAADDAAVLKDEIADLKNKVAELERKLNQQDQSSNLNKPNMPKTNKYNQSNYDPMMPGFFQDEWNPFAEMEQMQQQMNRMFNNSVWRGQGSGNLLSGLNHFDPTTDIQETKEGYVVKLDIPGMEKGDINLEVKDAQLIVSGEKRSDKEENNQNKYYRRERSFGYFSRVVPLPQDANPEKVEAEYLNGILTVKIGKLNDKQKEKTAKKIEVK